MLSGWPLSSVVKVSGLLQAIAEEVTGDELLEEWGNSVFCRFVRKGLDIRIAPELCLTNDVDWLGGCWVSERTLLVHVNLFNESGA